MSAQYTINARAYYKLFFHAAKYPHLTLNGVLLGKENSQSGGPVTVDILDAIPLLHHWTSLSPMMEIGLDLAASHALSQGLKLVGYYQAPELYADTGLGPVGERVASKISSGFAHAIALVVHPTMLVTPPVKPFIPYLPSSPQSSWNAVPESILTFAPADLPAKAVDLVKNQRWHEKLGDFDDHLEDVRIGMYTSKLLFTRLSHDLQIG